MPLSRVTRTAFDVAKVLGHTGEELVGSSIRRFRKRMGLLGPIRILPYRGFGNHQHCFVMGRVLENKRVGGPEENDSAWNNMWNMVRRFSTAQVPQARVRIRFGQQEFETTSDDEGYFRLRLDFASPPDKGPWHDVQLELPDQPPGGALPTATVGRTLIPASESDFAIISDLDDTVIESHATDFWKIVRITCLNNARTRMPLPGVSAFYRALHAGPTGAAQNPFFYVSSSAWNLYDLMVDFLDLHQIPAGPILLRNLRISRHWLVKTGHRHKFEKAQNILATYPELKFLLIGDAGQDDPEIYRELVRAFPDRIAAIYIRRIPGMEPRAEIQPIIDDVAQRGVDMLLADETRELIEHALAHRFISPRAIHGIDEDAEEDARRPALADRSAPNP